MTREYSIPGVWTGWNNYSGTTYHHYTAEAGSRDDPVSTPLVGGKHVRPTSYSASWSRERKGTIYVNYNKYVVRKMAGKPNGAPTDVKYPGCAYATNLFNKAIANVADTKLNIPEIVGGLPQTISMVTNRSNQIAQTIAAVKNQDWRRALTTLHGRYVPRPSKGQVSRYIKDSSSLYLENLFGWQQLFSDIYNSVEFVHEKMSAPTFKPSLIKGFASEKAGYTKNSWNPYNYYGAHDCGWEVTNDAKASVMFAHNHPSAGRTLNNLGLLNPALAAWNLTRMSFVADWFFPLGDYLSAFTAPTGLQYKDGYISVYWRKRSFGQPAATLGYISNRLMDLPEIETGRFERAYMGAPTPSLPYLQMPNSLGQAITATALAGSRARV